MASVRLVSPLQHSLVVIGFLLFCITPLWPLSNADNRLSDTALFGAADANLKKGEDKIALEYLSALRLRFPDSSWVESSLLMSAKIHIKLNESFKARYLLRKLITDSYNEQIVSEAVLLLGDLLYADKIFNEALNYYKIALKLMTKTGAVLNLQPGKIYLRIAEMIYYQNHDVELAESYLNRIDITTLGIDEITLYHLLKHRFVWRYITPEDIGVEDGNISAIAVDGDDLWIGTWNGGVVRYSYSTKKIALFKQGIDSIADNSIRAIEVEKKRVWIGTYNGLSVYSKTNSSWSTIEKLGTTRPGKISVIRIIGGVLYVGTLGTGLWKYSNNTWSQVGDLKIPGEYILCLDEIGKTIYIGTMTKGIYLLNKDNGKITSFTENTPGLKSVNITMLLADKFQRLWIGTYGEGLVMWEMRTNQLSYFTRKSGEIQDDWILCGVEATQGVYFGTFGGGASFYSFRDQNWESIGLAAGLNSLDIAALAYSDPLLYFGTLGTGISIYKEQSDDETI